MKAAMREAAGEAAWREAAGEAASPWMTCTSDVGERGSEALASPPRKRARGSPRDAEDPATYERSRRESEPRVGILLPSPERDCGRSAPRKIEAAASTSPSASQNEQEASEVLAPQVDEQEVAEVLAPPVAWFDARRYGNDTWTEVAKHMCSRDLLSLLGTCRWLRSFVSDDSIWRDAFFRDLGLPNTTNLHSPRPPHRSWRQLYCRMLSGSHAFLASDNELRGWRVGGFILDAPEVVLTCNLPLPPIYTDDVHRAITTSGACVLTNARLGIWLADMQIITSFSGCRNHRSCKGMLQVLEARHTDVLPHEILEHEELGENKAEGDVKSALCAIFDSHHITSQSTAPLLNLKSWIAKRNIGEPKTSSTKHAVAVNSNLRTNKGLLTMFLTARGSIDQQIVSIRMVQSVC